jgi:hypothetical protein
MKDTGGGGSSFALSPPRREVGKRNANIPTRNREKRHQRPQRGHKRQLYKTGNTGKSRKSAFPEPTQKIGEKITAVLLLALTAWFSGQGHQDFKHGNPWRGWGDKKSLAIFQKSKGENKK